MAMAFSLSFFYGRGVLDAQLEATVRHPDGGGCEERPLEVETRHHHRDTVVHVTDDVLGRDAAVVEQQLTRLAAAEAHLHKLLRGGEAGRVAVDHEGRDPVGAGVAVGLRIVFTVAVVYLLATPFLKIAGGLLLFWIAVKLLLEDEADAEGKIAETDRLWHAVRTIAIADMVMSLDNVLAIAAVAKDSIFLLILGLAISIPLIVAGAALIMMLDIKAKRKDKKRDTKKR